MFFLFIQIDKEVNFISKCLWFAVIPQFHIFLFHLKHCIVIQVLNLTLMKFDSIF